MNKSINGQPVTNSEKKRVAFSCTLASISLVLLILSIIFRSPAVTLLSLVLLILAGYVALKCKKIFVSLDGVTARCTLGIMGERKYTPVECGFFVTPYSSTGKKIYIDKRCVKKTIPPDAKKYIYISEYMLSEDEMSGSQYIFGEPILIFEYSDEAYRSISRFFDFNCEPFK